MILYLLNLLDLASTLLALFHGAVELNPIMDFCISLHPVVFAAVKLIPSYFLCRWLEGKQSYPYLVGAFAATVGNNLYLLHLLTGGPL